MKNKVAPRPRFGIRTLTTGGLLGGALAGLAVLDRQIPRFGFGDQGPDARSFPRLALGALALALVIRLGLGFMRGATDASIGPGRRLAWTLALALVSGLALVAMPVLGYFAGAGLVGVATALLLGERRPVLGVLVPVVIAGIVTLGARWGLHIPLP
ncbi:MAG: tripartite tricarboxylate transporter TctB family protein [Rhodospirillum sp.]|nr:tripartite tricarboxylate transporter TctB family protein [Rhodospirillum sp.]MCF8491313.1 tripartite tricarboxylate transporter TctB family protein [Rhodospirillum sp.]